MRILIIDDDQKLVDVLKRGLTELTYAVDGAYSGEEGEAIAKSIPYDLIILDILLPGKDGVEVCRELRRSNINTRIIMLTSKDTVTDRVTGLDSGADDYLAKPFAFAELLARIRATLRRELASGTNVLRVGNVQMDLSTREVKRDDTVLTLSGKEYALLEYFLRNPNAVLTRSMIEDHVWDFSLESESNLVDVYIRKLRKKIGQESQPGPIETIRGIGYRLKVQG